MTEFKKYLKNYSENELKLIGFMDSELGPIILNFLDACAEVSNSNPSVMKEICAILPTLIDCKPISPITKNDFEIVNKSEHQELLQCTRSPYIYKLNGKYYNDRAVAFVYPNSTEKNKIYFYNEEGSKQEITLPYYFNEEIRILNDEQIKMLEQNSEDNL